LRIFKQSKFPLFPAGQNSKKTLPLFRGYGVNGGLKLSFTMLSATFGLIMLKLSFPGKLKTLTPFVLKWKNTGKPLLPAPAFLSLLSILSAGRYNYS